MSNVLFTKECSSQHYSKIANNVKMSNSQEMIKSAVVYTIGIYEVPIITWKKLSAMLSL